MKKRVIFSAAMLLAATGAFAQGNGVGGIVEATNMVTSYFDPATKLIYAIGAVVGLIGGVKVYSKFSSGDPDTGQLVRGVYFPDCGSDHLTLILPVIWRSILSTRESAAVLSSKD